MSQAIVSYEKWKELLTPDEQEFVQAMVVMQCPVAASQMAGLTESAGRKLSKQAKIKTAVQLAKQDWRQQTHITPADIAQDLLLLRDMAFGRIPIAKTITTKEGDIETHYVRETNLAQAHKAIQDLGRMLGVFTDKKEITIPASDAQILKKLESILGVTIDGDAVDITPSPEEINAIHDEKEAQTIKAMSLDALADEILEDDVLRFVLEERLK